MEKVFLSRLEPSFAAALLRGCERLDPRGLATPPDIDRMTDAGQCFAATTDHKAQAVYVLTVKNGVAWIDAAKGQGAADWTALLLPIVEAQAQGLASVAFQTARPGLVKKAQAQGYDITGWVMRKRIQPQTNRA